MRHQRWMVRSFALCFAAVTLRLYLGAAMAGGLVYAQAYPVISFLCWVPNLVVAEIGIRVFLNRQRPISGAPGLARP